MYLSPTDRRRVEIYKQVAAPKTFAEAWFRFLLEISLRLSIPVLCGVAGIIDYNTFESRE
jgi:hypothetical protein